MVTIEQFRQLDLGALEAFPADDEDRYFCTPVGAEIFARAGVDGIHFCQVPGWGETIFAISPSNGVPDTIHPVAENLEGFLRLLLACGGTAAVEQAWMWDLETFADFLKEYPPEAEQQAAMESITAAFGLTPMEDPWGYLRRVQDEVSVENMPYSEEYYDVTGEERPGQERPSCPAEVSISPDQSTWKVTFDGGFWCGADGEPGRELTVNRTFVWDGETFCIPAVYLCPEGLVLDICKRVEPERIDEFFHNWELSVENEKPGNPTWEQREQFERDNPMALHVRVEAVANGNRLRESGGSGTSWNPCDEEASRPSGKQLMDHYGLDRRYGWTFQRSRIPWDCPEELTELTVTLCATPESVPGEIIRVSKAGDTVTVHHPITGEAHLLTVRELEQQTADNFPEDEFLYPKHYTAMTFTLKPELAADRVMLRDCTPGEQPRPRAGQDGGYMTACAPIMMVKKNEDETLYTACSSFRFAPPEEPVEWRLSVSWIPREPITVTLLENKKEEGYVP